MQVLYLHSVVVPVSWNSDRANSVGAVCCSLLTISDSVGEFRNIFSLCLFILCLFYATSMSDSSLGISFCYSNMLLIWMISLIFSEWGVGDRDVMFPVTLWLWKPNLWLIRASAAVHEAVSRAGPLIVTEVVTLNLELSNWIDQFGRWSMPDMVKWTASMTIVNNYV
jgi:hypothetical protein